MKFKFHWLKIIIIILLLVIYGLTLIHKINLTTDDLGRHITNGKVIWQTKSIPKTNFYSYTEPDFPFLNHHWLSGLLFYFLFSLVGFNGLIIFKIIILLIAFGLIFYIAAKKGNFWLAVIFSLPTIALLNQRTDVRPEIISFLFIAVFLYVLLFYGDKPNKKIFWLVPLQLIWVNCHIYWPVGILMVGGFLFTEIARHFNVPFRKRKSSSPVILSPKGEESLTNVRTLSRIRERFFASLRSLRMTLLLDSPIKSGNDRRIIKKFTILLLLLILVSFINPAGIKGVTYPLRIFKSYGYQIVENKSPFFLENLMIDPTIPFFKFVFVILLISFLFNLGKHSIFYFLASVAVVIGSAKMIRMFPLLGLIALPVLSINFSPLLKYSQETLRKKYQKAFVLASKILPSLIAAILLLITILVFNQTIKFNRKQFGIGLTFQSNNSAQFFKENNLQGPIFNNYDIGSYLIFHLFNQEKIFVDNRPEAYSIDFFEYIYKPMQLNDEVWQEKLKDYNFNAIFFTHQESTPWGRTFVNKRFRDSDWALVHADAQAVIFLKNTAENKEIIDKFHITAENIEERISEVINSSDIKTRFSAINLLKLIGRLDLASKICGQIIEQNPNNGQAYLEMASIESIRGTQTGLLEAKRNLEKAIQLGQKLPSTYNQLGLVNFNLGQYQEAKQSWEKALKINKNDESAKSYLKQYKELNLP